MTSPAPHQHDPATTRVAPRTAAARGAVLLAGAAVLLLLVQGRGVRFFWVPLLLGVTYLLAAAAGRSTGPLWAPGWVLGVVGLTEALWFGAGRPADSFELAQLTLLAAGTGALLAVAMTAIGVPGQRDEPRPRGPSHRRPSISPRRKPCRTSPATPGSTPPCSSAGGFTSWTSPGARRSAPWHTGELVARVAPTRAGTSPRTSAARPRARSTTRELVRPGPGRRWWPRRSRRGLLPRPRRPSGRRAGSGRQARRGSRTDETIPGHRFESHALRCISTGQGLGMAC